MNIQILREKIYDFFNFLNANYKPANEKPYVKVAEVALFLPALGLFYLWEYFSEFKIMYFLYFDIKDALEVLYSNLMPIILVGAVFSVLLGMLVPDILKRKNSNPDSDKTTEEGENLTSAPLNAISNLFAWIIAFVALFVFFLLMQIYQFGISSIVALMLVASVATYLYVKGYRNLGFIFLLILSVSFAATKARSDAELVKRGKPTFTVILKNHGSEPILNEGLKYRYLIYKTSNYYFIKDDHQNKIFAYGITNDEITSFTSE